MNFGIHDLKEIIYKQLVRGNVDVHMSGGRNKFAKDLATTIYEKLEVEMHPDMKTIARARGIPDPVIDFSERACKALGFSAMPLDEVSIDAYKWIMEQEAKGQTIEAFADWARTDEQGKYMGKYRKGAGNIKNEWLRAFTDAPGQRMLADDVRI